MRLNHVSLACADVARSLAFYRGLGFSPIAIDEAPDGSLRSARLAAPEGDATLALEHAAPAPERGGSGSVPGLAAALPVTIFLECQELDARVEQLADAGYGFASPPRTKPWLWREAELIDPDGHRLCLYRAGSYRRDPPWKLAAERGGPAGDDARDEAGDDPFAVFLAARNHGYGDARLPAARDAELAARLEALIAGEAAARDAAASRLGPAYTATLLAFAERMATTAVRARSERQVLLGLVALGLGWREAADVRDLVPVLGLLHDAAGRAGADAAPLFHAAAGLCPTDVAGAFRDFLTRPDLEGIAEEMGYVAAADRDGFRYRRLWGRGLI